MINIMKNMNLLILSAVLACLGCDPVTDVEASKPRPDSPESIVYSDAAEVPVIHPIDESGYTVYYLDAVGGDDSNDGLSEDKAFRTFAPVEKMKKEAGTKILLKRGCTFAGPLVLCSLNGTYEKPFIVDSYGEGDRPVITGGTEYAVLIQDDNVRFRNITVTNKTGKRGIYVWPVREGAMKNFEITGCRFDTINWLGDHDVETMELTSANVTEACSNGNYNKLYGGVIFEGPDVNLNLGPSWFENVFITDNEFYKVCRTAINVNSRWGDRTGRGRGRNRYIDDDHNWWPSKNIVAQGNELDYIGGDGIMLNMTAGGFIDHNRCYNANFLGRPGQANVAMWPYSSRNVVMQFNEAAYTRWENGSSDGEGLDIDIACRNTIVQYNYVHHNAGGGILLCNRGGEEYAGIDHSGSVIRNNVFLFNGGKQKGSFMMVSTHVGSTEAYNNIVITDGDNPRILHSDDWYKEGKSENFTFRNNIFISTKAVVGIFDHSAMDNVLFENNLYWNLASDFSIIDAFSLMYDPQISVPGNMDGYDKGQLCRPANARVFEDGMLFDGMASEDYMGNPVQGIRYLGAFAQ